MGAVALAKVDVGSVTLNSIALPIGATTSPSLVLMAAVVSVTADTVRAALVDVAVGVPLASSPTASTLSRETK